MALRRPDSFKPLELIEYGACFYRTALAINLSDAKLREVMTWCAEFLVKYINELTERLPSCIEAVERLKAFTPSITLRIKGRPRFCDMPMDFIRELIFFFIFKF